MSEPSETPVRTHDDAIKSWVKSLINGIVKSSEDNTHLKTPQERLIFELRQRADDKTMVGITGLSSYLSALAADRQATALESLAKAASRMAMSEASDTTAQAIVDDRESKRDYLASTYSLPTETLLLLWAMRGMLVDASIKSLSRPDRFDPYRRLTTKEIAWSLRLTDAAVWNALPRTDSGDIDYELLEAFDLMHYGGSPTHPDDWMYGG